MVYLWLFIFLIFEIKGVIIEKASRTIYLKSSYVQSEISITYKNDGDNSLDSVDHYILTNYSQLLLDIIPVGPNGANLKFSKVEKTNIKIFLPSPLLPKNTINIKILELYRDRFNPNPKYIKMDGRQSLVYNENRFIITPYRKLVEETQFIIPNSDSLIYATPSFSLHEEKVNYGPFRDIDPMENDPIIVHIYHSKPLLIFESVEREIEISHYGNIFIKENYHLKNKAAQLDGEYDRNDYAKVLYSDSVGTHIVKSIKTQLPRSTFDLYYRDEVGNISTSNAAKEANLVYFEISPRYPLLGGWQTKWEQGYYLPNAAFMKRSTEENSLTLLNQSFGYSFKEIPAIDYTLRVILPPGAKNVRAEIPFEVDEHFMDKRYSYLDLEGRLVLVLKKANMHNFYSRAFYVSYNLADSLFNSKALILIGIFLGFLLMVIISARLNISFDKTR